MQVEQLSIFIENKAGRLAEITKTLADAKVNIRALSLTDTSDYGILRLIVDDTERAKATLKESGFTAGVIPVVAVLVPDTPGGLDAIVQLLGECRVNIEYMYAFVKGRGNQATIIFRFDDINRAIAILKGHNVTILGPDDILGD